MAVIVQYIVEKDGIQKMTFTDKKEAEAYDKELDIAANLLVLIEASKISIDEDQLEELCLYLAKNKDEALPILKGAKPKTDKKAKPNSKPNKPANKNKTVSSNHNKPSPSAKDKKEAAAA